MTNQQAGPEPAHQAGQRLIAALVARDYAGLFGALARDARFRYLVPSGPGQIDGAADAADKFFGWFGDAETVTVRDVRVEPMADRTSARYRFLVRKAGAWKEIEQQAYLDVDEAGQIASIDLLCSGFRPADVPQDASTTGIHEFDAGQMSCSDGLAPEFRRRIGAIPLGDLLVVTARDPAAKEDLPPLARLMGHAVRSVEASGDGRLVITVERGR